MNHSPIIMSPIHGPAVNLGAQFVELAGWQVPQFYQSVEEEMAVARSGVGLADISANGKIEIIGQSAEAVLQAAFAMPATKIGQGIIADSGNIYRLRNDFFLIQSLPGSERTVIQRLTEVILEMGERVTVTDISHGRADLLLAGPASAIVLSRVCGLDFQHDKFPNLSARQSSVAKCRQLILRRDLGEIPAYSLIGARSLAVYLWETVLEAGHDLGIIPIGQDALERFQQINQSDG